jgi:hypothetical protein
MNVPKGLKYSSITVFLITSVVWIIGVTHHTFLAQEFWLYVGIFTIPAALVCGSFWLMFDGPTWRRIFGLIILVPSLGVWGLSLLLVSVGFKIH